MLKIKKPDFPLGLDISDKILKAIELKTTKDKIKLGAISKYRLKAGDIVNGEIKNHAAVKSGIETLLSKPSYGSFNSTEVIACLPDTKTFIKLITIEKTPNTLKQVINSHIEKHIPMPIQDIYYDWQIIDENSSEYQVLIGAAAKSVVNEYVDILNDAKLSIVAFEIEPVAIARALLKEETKKYNGSFNKNYCIIDIGAKRTSLTIYSKNTILFSISLPLSGDDTTELIAKSLEIKKDEAEKAKIFCGLDKSQANGIVSDILSDQIKNLAQKIESSLDFFNKHYPETGPISQIMLCGGGSNIKNLDKSIEEIVKIPTIISNPLINLNVTEEVEKKFFAQTRPDPLKETEDPNSYEQNTVSSYTTAIGLALRNVFIDKI